MRASLVAALAALLLTGCQSYPSGAGRPSPSGYWSRGYDIVGGGARDAAQVKQVLATIAAQTNLSKRSPSPNDYSPLPFALYGDSRVQLLANRHKDYVHVDVTRYNFSGAAAFARVDGLVRNTLSRKFGHRLYAEPEPDYSHPIITY
jgi:hypothetical protein